MNRKLRKLKRDPKLFFKDMYDKYALKIKKHIPFKYTGNHHFTVVTAVYNVEKYLDDFFDSLVKQTLSFKKHIQIICVDDGSQDRSAEIIKKWQKKYPNNIHYIYKENGGQASARNLGLESVETEWVTFIDPDDFISPDYFYKINKTLSQNKDLSIIAIPFAVYKEETGTKLYNTTPLTYCFNQKNKKVKIKKLDTRIQLSVCTSIFNLKIIKENRIQFNESIKPCFEDGKFVLDYFLVNSDNFIYFLDDVFYFYRVRRDNSSTTNTQWQKREKYLDVFKYGYIPMFEEYQLKYNHIPQNVQFTFLFFAIQYLKLLVNDNRPISFLDKTERKDFSQLFLKCMEYIEKSTIMKFHLHGCNFFYKYCLLSLKGEKPDFTYAYIDSIDSEKGMLNLRLYINKESNLDFYIDGKAISPIFKKENHIEFLNTELMKEYRIWLPISQDNKNLTIKTELPVKISYGKHEYNSSIAIKTLEFTFNKNIKNNWLFIDKDTKADDNAEHFYRYMAKNHPEQPIYFALNRDSSDWERLQSENFNLIEFGSPLFEQIFRDSSVLLSSNADRYFMAYFGNNSLEDKKFIFLQHGVIMHDLSKWLNSVPKVSLFVTSTVDEYSYIKGESSYYKYSPEVKLTGLARHDSLLQKSTAQKRQRKNILIMPTWRNNIVGKFKAGSTNRELNENFTQTEYFKHWYSLLHSKKLKMLCDQYNYSISFVPHPNVHDYLSLFNLPDYIQQPSLRKSFSIQSALVDAAFLITDYSSITFDMAFLEKGTLYYQFDSEEFFSGSHSLKEGYFTYEKNGFGMISHSEKSLLNDISMILNQQGKFPNKYRKIIHDTFKYRDGKNCERTYNEIINSFISHDSKNYQYILDDIESALRRNMPVRAKELYSYIEKDIPDGSLSNDVLTRLNLIQQI